MTKQVTIKEAHYVKDVTISLRTNSQLKAIMEEVGKRKGMNLTDYLNEMILAQLKQEGIAITVNRQF